MEVLFSRTLDAAIPASFSKKKLAALVLLLLEIEKNEPSAILVELNVAVLDKNQVVLCLLFCPAYGCLVG
jgi:hypothetical protein